MAITAQLYDFVVRVVEEKTEGIRLLRSDFSDLRAVVYDLAKDQRELRTAVNDLANDQRELRAAVKELAQAQKGTEQRVEELAQAQKETEKEMRGLATAVGSLSDTIGYGIEDIAKVVIPGYLFRHKGIDIKDELERRFFSVKGKEVEIDLYGEGITKQGKKIKIFGECKSKIKEAEVNKFVKHIKKLEEIEGEILKVMCGFYIHPTATKLAERENIILIASYQR